MSSGLDTCALAWGNKQGYVCLSIRNPELEPGTDGYWQDRIFEWPNQRQEVKNIIVSAKRAKQDLYWSPMVYSKPKRSKKAATPTELLWADLDEADPRTFDEPFKPTAWWETSPGRFQALWVTQGEPMTPETQELLNKKLTYAVGADKGGWDMTQVLRVPETPNHKYDNIKVTKAHVNGRAPAVLDLFVVLDKIKVSGGGGPQETPTADLPSPEAVLKKNRRKISAKAKQILKSRTARGDRSEILWELECLLAESGLKVDEIVALCKHSVWNKFDGRTNEIEILTREARKAIAHVHSNRSSDDVDDSSGDDTDSDDDGSYTIAEDDDPDVEPITWGQFDRDRKQIKWLVADVWGEAEVGFISGLPKSYKSWLALDLAVSVATGTRFLGSFQALRENVILIQEEDPKVVMQDRLGYIAGAKGLIECNPIDETSFEFKYDLPDSLHIVSNSGFQVTDEDWMDMLGEWIVARDAKLVILDPLSMIAGGFDEFKLFDTMQKVFKPLKRLRAETGAAICVVHHHIKSSEKSGASAMYGSVAGWAWEESAIHLAIGAPGKLIGERFSKHSQLSPLTIEIGDIEDIGWHPLVYEGNQSPTDILDILSTYESGMTIDDLEAQMKLGRDAIQRQLKKLEDAGKVRAGLAPSQGKGRRKKSYVVAK